MKKVHKAHYRWANVKISEVKKLNVSTVLGVLNRVAETSAHSHMSDMRVNIVTDKGAILSGYVFYDHDPNMESGRGFVIYSNRNNRDINETNSSQIPVHNIIAMEWANKTIHYGKAIRDYSSNKPLCPTIAEIEMPYIENN